MLLCAPAVFGWVDKETASVLCCFAGISEMSWEWEEYSERLFRRFCQKGGRVLEPTPVLYLFGLHHVLGLFVIPMNLYYYDEYYYWTMIGWS